MYQRILLPIDLNHPSSWERSLPIAVQMCQSFGAGLHVFTVVPDYGMSMVSTYFPPGTEQKLLLEARQRLEAFTKEQVPEGIRATCDLGHGSITKQILEAAEKVDADLIVMASHRPELQDYLIGPNAANVVRHAPRSVLVVR